jgi:glycosyltransferase involved in cell wall biosynthesis
VNRLVHVITGLGLGGTEHRLLRLAREWAHEGIDQHVVVLGREDRLADQYRAVPIGVTTLGLRGIADLPGGLKRLRDVLGWERPDAVLTWMYHANLLGGFAARGMSDLPVIWNVLASRITADVERPRTVVLARAAGFLAPRLCRLVVFNSRAGAKWHTRWGYPENRSVVIPNGVDVRAFRRDEAARRRMRGALGLCGRECVIGMLARYAPIKGHRYFVSAIEALLRARAQPGLLAFVLGGTGVDAENAELRAELAPLRDRVPIVLAGEVRDPAAFYSALDVLTVPSVDEAFPNVLVEAMACQVPCVVTDVGDCADIVGTTGLIVPARDPTAIARAWLGLVDEGEAARSCRGEAARQRVAERFSLGLVSRWYLATVRAVASGRAVADL